METWQVFLIIAGAVLVLVVMWKLVRRGKPEGEVAKEGEAGRKEVEKEVSVGVDSVAQPQKAEEKRLETEKQEPGLKDGKIEEEKEEKKEEKKAEKEKLEPEMMGEKEHGLQIAPIRKGLEKTRGGLILKLKQILGGKKEIDPELLAKIEELFITSDIGVRTTELFIQKLKENLSSKELMDEQYVWGFIRQEALRILNIDYKLPVLNEGDVYVIMVVGVNGTGKTTTIGKLANRFQLQGKKVLLAAADTFRAAATSQLEVWAKRVGCEVVKGKEGADPSSVVFEAIEKARSGHKDVVIADTAGRLHTKIPLMEELKKIKRVMGKAQAGAPHEVLLVLDATTGQNGLAQARSFLESLEVTGIVLTKLDGTARGGVILSICNEMKIPIRFIGIGEGVEDLKQFSADEFVTALFDEIAEKEVAA